MSDSERITSMLPPTLVRQELLKQLENIVLELNAHEERNDLIKEIDQAILRSTFSAQEVLNLIVQKCLYKTGSKHGQVVEYRHNHLTVVASTEFRRIRQELPLNHSLCGTVITTGELQHVPDVSLLPPDKYVRYNENTRSELAIPIKAEHSERILGVLNLERDQEGYFDEKSVEFAHLLAGQAAIAMTHAQTWSGVKLLYELSTSLLSGKLTLEEGFQRILDSILQEFDFEHGQILLSLGNEFVILASSSNSDIGLRLGKESSACGFYLLEEKGRGMLVIDDIEKSRYSEFYIALLHAEGGRSMHSEMIVPLIEKDRLIGALNIESPRIGIFSDFERNILGVVGTLMASAISATFSRRNSTNQRQIQAANIALTQLGHAAEKFIHNFINSVGSARAKLFELNEHLVDIQLPAIRDGIPVNKFVSDVTENLSEAAKALRDFGDSFNPSHTRYQLQEMDMEKVANTAFERAKARYVEQPINFQFVNKLPSATGTHKPVKGQSSCLLSEPVYEVIDSIVNNAAEAILERGRDSSGLIKFELDLPDPFHVRLGIEDNGGGIPEDDQPRILEYGFTTKKNRESQGIGLWFCDLYLRQRGGSINFVSESGKGTLFNVIFPTILTEHEEF